ncbi:hypothetical protein FRB96_000780 [Tulasnella sp. 330]|nr:hypothetical protein FRB96_000780 [Tulasnella sp. 330]KAG8888864.1 hypothetical protein FRB98_006650 [Tulasnella sp. 332]
MSSRSSVTISRTPARENTHAPKSPASATQASSSLKPLTLGSSTPIITGPRPLQLAGISNHESTSNILSPTTSTISTEAGMISPRPGLSRSASANGRGGKSPRPVSMLNFEKDGLTRTAQKRMSSICYSSSLRDAPPNITVLNGAVRSPALERFNPLSSPAPVLYEETNGERAEGSKRVTGSTVMDNGENIQNNDSSSNTKSPPVLTLAEKHADLLRFIASKESKCYELRTQLEQHEAELLVLKKKWERIVSKSKPEGVNAGGSKDGGGSESVRTALKEVGRLLVGGGFGYIEETPSVSPASWKSPSPSSPPDQSAIATPVATLSSNSFNVESRRSSSEVVRRSGSFKLSSKDNASRRTMMQASPPRSSVSSPTSTLMTMSGTSSTRDSVSSVSTNMSSMVGDTTPIDKVASSSSPSTVNQTPASALDDLARSTKPWIPLPNGLNKTWEHLQKTPTFEKHSKRASILVSDVSDMSTSFLGSLSTALLSSGGPSSAPTMAMAGKRRSPAPTTSSPQRLSTASLLDDDEDLLTSAGGTLSVPIKPWSSPASTSPPILQPSAPPPPLLNRSTSKKKQAKSTDTDDEDWNW